MPAQISQGSGSNEAPFRPRIPLWPTWPLLLILAKQVLAAGSPAGAVDPKSLLGSSPGSHERPLFLAVAPPKDYTERSLREALRQRLTPVELGLVTNPLAVTPAIGLYAREVTAGATNDLQKAQMLFAALASRAVLKAPGFDVAPTAAEAFAAWKTPEPSLRCGDFTVLYIAAARSLGLKAYDVEVEEDCYGGRDLHGCAAVFFHRGAVLADVTYFRFGVPHKRFTVLDDLQSIGVFLGSHPGLDTCRLASKLAPGLALPHLNLLEKLVAARLWDEAQRELAIVEALDPGGPMAHYARAELALFHQGNSEQALKQTRKALRLAPHMAGCHYLLAAIYMRQGKWPEARSSYENAMRFASYGRGARIASQGMAWADAQACCAKGDLRGAITNYGTAIELGAGLAGQHLAQLHLARGAVEHAKGDWDAALADYNQAIELGPATAQAYSSRAGVRQAKGELGAALADYGKAIELEPRLAELYAHRAGARLAARDADGALADADKALELGPATAEAYANRAGARQAKGDLEGALTDYGKAIKLSPRLAAAYGNRGYVRQIQGSFEGAFADYRRALELDQSLSSSMAAMLVNRGCVDYDRHRFAEALSDFRMARRLGLADDRSPFRIWLIRTRLGQAAEATEELRAYLDHREAGAEGVWRAKIGSFLIHQLPEERFLDAAKSPDEKTTSDQRCDAFFYSGTVRLIGGDKATAAQYFEKCIATGANTKSEYTSAAAELEFLRSKEE